MIEPGLKMLAVTYIAAVGVLIVLLVIMAMVATWRDLK